jgi:hypothetical protein
LLIADERGWSRADIRIHWPPQGPVKCVHGRDVVVARRLPYRDAHQGTLHSGRPTPCRSLGGAPTSALTRTFLQGSVRRLPGRVGPVDAMLRWLTRLGELPQSAPPAARYRRVLVPGFEPLDFDRTLIRMVAVGPLNQGGQWPGRGPQAVSYVQWLDLASQDDASDEQAIATDLAGLLTFISDRRIEIVGTEVPLRQEGTSRLTFLPIAQLPDRSLFGPIEASMPADLEMYLARMVTLSSKDQKAIGAALALHYDACLLMELDVSAAYALLVGALEALSRRFGSPPTDWGSWDEATRFDRVFQEAGLTDEQVAAMRVALVAQRQVRLKRTFAEYGAHRLPDSFWNREFRDFVPTITLTAEGGTHAEGEWQKPLPLAGLVPSDRDNLRRCLMQSYDARSEFVHQGKRSVSIMGTAAQIARGVQTEEAVPMLGLRTMVRALIHEEIFAHSSVGELPRVVLCDEVPPDAENLAPKLPG